MRRTGMLVLVPRHIGAELVLGAVVEDTDGTVLADAIGHFQGVDPHGQLVGEEFAEVGLVEAADIARFRDQGVHFVVDAEAAVSRTLAWFLGEPVVLVVVFQELLQGPAEHVDPGDFDLAVLQPEQVGEEGGRGFDFHSGSSSGDDDDITKTNPIEQITTTRALTSRGFVFDDDEYGKCPYYDFPLCGTNR